MGRNDVGGQGLFGRGRDLEAAGEERGLDERAVGPVGSDDERVAVVGLAGRVAVP
jgi:hypothetical protein